MMEVAKFLRANGLFTFTQSNMVFVVPPLCITEAQLDEGLAIIDRAIEIADAVCTA
jgi:taurine--2-oxoglutarate transaminase